MRVLLSCLQGDVRHSLPAYDFWRRHFIEGLNEAGATCIEVPGVDWAMGLVCQEGPTLNSWKDRTWQATIAAIRGSRTESPVDLFLGYLYPQQVDTQAIREIQRIGVPCVNFFCDNVREFRKLPAEFYPFDLHWVPEFEALDLYTSASLPHVNSPMPCWVPLTARRECAVESEPPTFLGSADVLRRDLLARAVEMGVDIKVAGVGWIEGERQSEGNGFAPSALRSLSNQVAFVKKHGCAALIRKLGSYAHPFRARDLARERMSPSVSREEYVRITREAMVTIGINRVPTARRSNWRPLRYSRLRDLEAPMMGACYLSEWTEGLARLYEVGVEIETYRTPEELSWKLKELQRSLNLRRQLRSRGQARALAEHSVAKSLQTICARLGLPLVA